MPDQNIPWMLLERYCVDACTPQQKAELERWIAEKPERQVLVERMRGLLVDTQPRPNQADIEREWARLEAAMKRHSDHRLMLVSLIAAGLFTLLGVAWIVSRHAMR